MHALEFTSPEGKQKAPRKRCRYAAKGTPQKAYEVTRLHAINAEIYDTQQG